MWSVLVVISVLSSQGSKWISFSGEPEGRPQAAVIEHSDIRTVVEVTVPGMREEKRALDGREFSFLSFPLEADFLEVEGKPGLPVILKWVAIPDDKDVSLRIISYDCDTVRGYVPMPAQNIFEYQKKGLIIDEEFYSSGSTYPEKIAVIDAPEMLRDYRYVVLTLHPVRYNPVEDEIYVCSKIEVELTYSGVSPLIDGNVLNKTRDYTSHAFEPLYRHHFINYDHVKSEKTERGIYLVLVPDAYYNSILPLADWRHRKGMETRVTRLSEIGSPITDTLIRSYVMNACTTWEVPPEYVLLVGDVATTPYHPGSTPHGGAADEKWLAPNCLESRISVDNVAELDAVVNRIIDYERNPYLQETAWYRKACFSVSNPFSWHDAVAMKNKLLAYGFTHADTFMDTDSSATRANLINAINDGRLIVLHKGHGGGGSWFLHCDWPIYEDFSSTDVEALSNGRKLPMLFSGGCATNRFQGYDECIGETWTELKGMVYEGSSRVYANSSPSRIGRHIIDRYCDSIYVWGQIGKGRDPFVMLGDPGLTIWGDIPAPITCTYDGTMPGGSNYFNVLVKQGANPVKGATVCLMSTNDVYAVGETDAGGNVTLNPAPETDDTVYVTVTSPFHIPHEGIIMVDYSVPFPGYLSHILDDATGGNGNGITNPGEIAQMSITLKNYGQAVSNNISATLRTTDTMLTITDSSRFYGSLAPGAQTTQAFTFVVPDSYPYQGEGMLIPFDMQVTDDAKNTWEFPVPEEEIRVPDIVYVSHTVPGDPGPGDTAEITVTMENAGNDSVSFATARISTEDPFITILTDSSSFGAMGIGSSTDNVSNPFEFVTHPTTPEGRVVTFTLHPQSRGWINWTGTSNQTFEVIVGDSLSSFSFFFDDFESGLTHWTFDGGSWSDSTLRSHSPAHSLTLVPDTTLAEQIAAMNFGLDVSQYKPPLTISLQTSWAFNPWTEYESHVDMSTDGGSIWNKIFAHVCPAPPDTKFHYWHGSIDSCGPGFTDVRFRVRLQELSQQPPDTACWFIDDFAVTTPNDNVPPSFGNTTIWNDTLYPGPFPVTSTIADDMYGVAQCSLYYRIDAGAWTAVLLDTTGNPNEYTCAIPAQDVGDTVSYYLAALDSFPTPNRGTDPVGAPSDVLYSFVIKGIGTEEKEIPRVYQLRQNYPNPFAGATIIRYALPGKSRVSLRIYDLSGRLVKTLVDREQKPGFHGVKWDARDNSGRKAPVGVFFYKLDAGGFKSTKKLVLF